MNWRLLTEDDAASLLGVNLLIQVPDGRHKRYHCGTLQLENGMYNISPPEWYTPKYFFNGGFDSIYYVRIDEIL